MLDKEAHCGILPPPELNEIISSIWSLKGLILGICLVFLLLSTVIAFNTANTYRADALLVSTEALQGSGNDMASQLTGLASLAGINNIDSKGFKAEVAQAKMLTKEFLYKFIDEHNLKAKLIAAIDWDKETNSLIYDESMYDEKSNTFLPAKKTNLKWLAYKEIIDNLIIDKDNNGLIIISYEHYSPYVAQEIVENLINDINQLMQNFDVEQADKSIKYLSEKLNQTNVADMKTVFYKLIEEQMKNKMLTEIKSEYIFTTIDPALVPEEKSGPKRILIIVVSTFLAGILGCFIALTRFYRKR